MTVYAGPDRRTTERREHERVGATDRRRGRPRLVEGQDTTTVTVRLPSGLHDDACMLAADSSLGAVIRRALRIYVSAKTTKR